MTVDELIYHITNYIKHDNAYNNYRVVVRYEGEELNIKGPIVVSTNRTMIINLRKD